MPSNPTNAQPTPLEEWADAFQQTLLPGASTTDTMNSLRQLPAALDKELKLMEQSIDRRVEARLNSMLLGG